jgi:hypothetical protein
MLFDEVSDGIGIVGEQIVASARDSHAVDEG